MMVNLLHVMSLMTSCDSQVVSSSSARTCESQVAINANLNFEIQIALDAAPINPVVAVTKL